MNSPFLLSAMILFVGSLAVSILRRILAGAAKSAVGDGEGCILPSRSVLFGASALGFALSGAAFQSALLAPHGQSEVLLGLLCLALALGAASALLPGYEVTWSDRGIEGPSQLWFPPFGPSRRFIDWNAIDYVGQDAWGNWFVADAGGNRIRWNFLYAGHGHLMAEVGRVCPDLFPHLAARA